MVAFIEGHGLRRLPGYVTEDIPSILWEGQGNPDAWKDFVEMAKHVGAPFVTFSEMTLERDELDALIEQASEMNFPDEEATELVEAKWLRKYAGMLGYIQLGFVYQGIVFLHETTTEWYERFQALLEDIEGFQDIVIDDARPRRRGRVSAVGAAGTTNHPAAPTTRTAPKRLASPALDLAAQHDAKAAEALAREARIPQVLAELLVARGIAEPRRPSPFSIPNSPICTIQL